MMSEIFFNDFYSEEIVCALLRLEGLDKKNKQLGFYSMLVKNNFLQGIVDRKYDNTTLNKLISIGYNTKNHGLLLSMGAQYFAAGTALSRFFINEYQKELCRDVFFGGKIVSFAATEINAGSDIMAMETSYEVEGNNVKLNGKKIYITNALTADYFLVYATSNQKLRDRGVTLFLVPRDAKGVVIEPLKESNRLCDGAIGCITMKDTLIPKEFIVGKERQGFEIFNECMKVERCFIMVPQIGTMLRWYKRVIQHSKSRHQYMKPIYQYQNISDKIVSMHEKIKISYLLALDSFNNREITIINSSMVKRFISDALLSCHESVLSILGAEGLFGDKVLEDFTESFSAQLYSGSNEIQKNIIINSIMSNQR